MKLQFNKYSSTGNDFILIDNRQKLSLDWRQLAIKQCHRRLGIGADGLILLQESSKAAFRMVIFNADGSEAEMCGNGTRAIVDFAAKLGIDTSAKVSFETQNSIYHAEVINGEIKIEMSEVGQISKIGHPDFLKFDFAYFLDTGVPHAVLEVSNLDKYDVLNKGRALRGHAEFNKGANINFIKPLSKRLAQVRTYERGVEDETYSCGTGVMACAVALSTHYGWSYPITLETKGGRLSVDRDDDKYFLIGPTSLIYKGEIEVEH